MDEWMDGIYDKKKEIKKIGRNIFTDEKEAFRECF